MFSIKLYKSEFTEFMEGFLQQHPDQVEARYALPKTWWDRDLDAEELKGFREAAQPAKPYPYQPE